MLGFLLDAARDKFPLKIALIFERTTYTYAELGDLAQRLAASLSRRGIQPGDRVAFLLPNCLEIVLCYYACFKVGAIAVPLNIRFGPELLRHVIDHSGARVLISDPELFAP
jgi:acyl-CoA synthetase (AMP-forming)/AMP-acid ligase II